MRALATNLTDHKPESGTPYESYEPGFHIKRPLDHGVPTMAQTPRATLPIVTYHRWPVGRQRYDCDPRVCCPLRASAAICVATLRSRGGTTSYSLTSPERDPKPQEEETLAVPEKPGSVNSSSIQVDTEWSNHQIFAEDS